MKHLITVRHLINVHNGKTLYHMACKEGQFDVVLRLLVSIQWLKIPMDGLSDSMFLVSIQWLKIPMDELILI